MLPFKLAYNVFADASSPRARTVSAGALGGKRLLTKMINGAEGHTDWNAQTAYLGMHSEGHRAIRFLPKLAGS